MTIKVIYADITTLKVDAIVNAANTSLLGGGGVDGAIHKAAGPALLEECRTLNGCKTGEAKITQGYNLPANYVIHTPGPIYQGGTAGEADLLAACYHNALYVATQFHCRTIAFPCISTGVYGYPLEQAAQIAFSTVYNYLITNQSSMIVYFVCFDIHAEKIYQRILKTIRRKSGF